MPDEEDFRQRLIRLVTEISAQRTAARNGDENAQAWVAGLDYWLGQRAAGEAHNTLILTPDMLPLPADYTEVLEFKKGYQHIVELHAVGLESEHRA